MPLLRKARTLATIILGCRNWPEIVGAKLGMNSKVRIVELKNGLKLEVKRSIVHDWGEVFEAAVADVYRVSKASADLIVDVGANMGSFTCLAAWTHPHAQVYAFEPQPEVAERLRQNVVRNGLQNVHLIEAAATADGREVRFNQLTQDGSSGIFLEGDGQTTILKSVTLNVIPFASARRLFLKLDCEGAEGELIKWVTDHLGDLPPETSLVCEYHPWCEVPIARSETRLKEAGFDISREIHFDESYLFANRKESTIA